MDSPYSNFPSLSMGQMQNPYQDPYAQYPGMTPTAGTTIPSLSPVAPAYATSPQQPVNWWNIFHQPHTVIAGQQNQQPAQDPTQQHIWPGGLAGMEIMMLQNNHQPVPDSLWAKPAPPEDGSSRQA